MRASSCLPLPKELKVKREYLNIQNNDEKCFLWSILASLHPVQHRNHPDSVWKYKGYERELNMSLIKYLVDIKNIYLYIKKSSRYVLLMAVARYHVNLLYITAGETSHDVLMKDWSRLVSRQYNNHNDKKYFCQYCFHGCTSEEVLKNHLERSKLREGQRIKLPKADDKNGRDKVQFTKTEYQLRVPFVIYADFESVLPKQDLCESLSLKSFTTQCQPNIPCER